MKKFFLIAILLCMNMPTLCMKNLIKKIPVNTILCKKQLIKMSSSSHSKIHDLHYQLLQRKTDEKKETQGIYNCLKLTMLGGPTALGAGILMDELSDYLLDVSNNIDCEPISFPIFALAGVTKLAGLAGGTAAIGIMLFGPIAAAAKAYERRLMRSDINQLENTLTDRKEFSAKQKKEIADNKSAT